MLEKPGFPASVTVLVVDDEPITRSVFVRALRRLGCKVMEAVNIEEAMAVWREIRADLLIAEFMLRDGFGTDLALKIREHRPDVPVLLTWGTPLDGWTDSHRERFASLGARTDFLPKPFHIAALALKAAELIPVDLGGFQWNRQSRSQKGNRQLRREY